MYKHENIDIKSIKELLSLVGDDHTKWSNDIKLAKGYYKLKQNKLKRWLVKLLSM